MTNCAACGFENPTRMKCCGGCGEPLQRVCPNEEVGLIAYLWREAGDERRWAHWQKRAEALPHGAGSSL